ncbi:hypothetical protein BGZ83_007669 [Gryganskiella cystojenkinii]|nr:hypothetical protein BGZ83_007669 [Gryganskiella cystojenkinii]
MTRLTKKDNDTLRAQEWRLLKGSTASASLPSATLPSTTAFLLADQQQLPERYQYDTFLIKSFFSETEKCYLILLTNFKQCWFEKLGLEEIRDRSMTIRSFAYEEDAQLEALLLSLSDMFSTETPGSESSQCRLQEHHGKMNLIAEFDFGLASVQWEFRLSPLIVSTTDRESNRHGATIDEGEDDEDSDDLLTELRRNNTSSSKKDKSKDNRILKRNRRILDDGEDEDEEEGTIRRGDKAGVDGMAIMYDHVILPLITLTNVYRKQVHTQEGLIKAKENEVYEALEIMELSGINHRNRRKVTQPYQKGTAETNVQSDIELLVRPQLLGPKELFAEKNVTHLCSVITKHAAEEQESRSQRSTSHGDALSQDLGAGASFATLPSSSSQGGLDHRRSTRQATSGETMDTATISLHGNSSATLPIAGTSSADSSGNVGRTKTTKEEEELERRRVLQEQLDREKEEKARSSKKKKLF